MANYRVYLLINKKAQRYIGLSENPEIRLHQHNANLSRWTAGKGPWTLVWLSHDLSLAEARKLENKLKKQKGGRSLDHVVASLRA